MNRLREEMCRYHSIQLAGVVFQACSIDHSDISPFRFNDLRTVRNSVAQNLPSRISDPRCRVVPIVCGHAHGPTAANCVRPSNLAGSRTTISMSCCRSLKQLRAPSAKVRRNDRRSIRPQRRTQARSRDWRVRLCDDRIGRTRQKPDDDACETGGRGRRTVAAKKPSAKRAQNAPAKDARRSGNDNGSISSTSTAPITRPSSMPRGTRLMTAATAQAK